MTRRYRPSKAPCSNRRASNYLGALSNALRTAAGRAGWGAVELPKNTGLGIACVSSQERATATWTACAAVVEVNPTNGSFEVKKLTVAMDLGTVVNPDGVKAQVEGSALWGMSLALFEAAPLKNGALQVSNFGDYTPLRMSEMPELDISIIANNDPPCRSRRPRCARSCRRRRPDVSNTDSPFLLSPAGGEVG